MDTGDRGCRPIGLFAELPRSVYFFSRDFFKGLSSFWRVEPDQTRTSFSDGIWGVGQSRMSKGPTSWYLMGKDN